MAEAMVPDVVGAAAAPVVIDPDEARRQMKLLQDFIRDQMEEGLDYGKVEGIDKPTLLKPGAEKLDFLYGYSAQYELVKAVEDWDEGFFAYTFRCRVLNKRTGAIEGESFGHANSREAKYRYVWLPEWKVPPEQRQGLPSREIKKGKAAGKKQYRVKNSDPYTLVNTLLKMAQKRAHVGATLAATRTSGIFTQDVEDMFPEDDADEGQASASAAKVSPPARRSPPKQTEDAGAEPPPFTVDGTEPATGATTSAASGANAVPTGDAQPQPFVLTANPAIVRGKKSVGAKIPAKDATGADVMLFATGDALLEKVKGLGSGEKVLATVTPVPGGLMLTEVRPDAA